jgi:hypothetical protein
MEQNTPQMTTAEAFNLLVSLVRQTKLSYQEHQTVDKAVNVVMEALNKKDE